MKELQEIFELRGRLEAMERKLEAAQKRVVALERGVAEQSRRAARADADLHTALARQARLRETAKELAEGVQYYSTSIPDRQERIVLLQFATVTRAALAECEAEPNSQKGGTADAPNSKEDA